MVELGLWLPSDRIPIRKDPDGLRSKAGFIFSELSFRFPFPVASSHDFVRSHPLPPPQSWIKSILHVPHHKQMAKNRFSREFSLHFRATTAPKQSHARAAMGQPMPASRLGDEPPEGAPTEIQNHPWTGTIVQISSHIKITIYMFFFLLTSSKSLPNHRLPLPHLLLPIP